MDTEKKNAKSNKFAVHASLLAFYTLALALVWTMIIVLSAAWNIYQKKQTTKTLATKEAHAYFNKNQAFRLWATKHGGVYVVIDERTPPNPQLKHVPERDITTLSGKKLTLMNPAYMLRQMMEEYSELYGVKGRNTSLKPFRSQNTPDEWERSALKAFENGVEEVFEFVDINGEPYLRLIRPLITKKGCLKCHGIQGYKVGDVRGGVGISVPMLSYLTHERGEIRKLVISHILIWLIGTVAIYFGFQRLKYQFAERERAEEVVRESEKKYRSLVESTKTIPWKIDVETGRFTYIGPQVEQVLGYPPDSWVDINAWSDRIHPDDRKEAVAFCLEATKRGEDHDFEYRSIDADGKIVWIRDFVTVLVGEQGPLELIGYMFDVTERKMAEQALLESEGQLRALAARLTEVEEDERKRLAQELHDRVGQNLTALNINLNIMKNLLSDESTEKIATRLADSMNIVAEATLHIRDVMAKLRPQVLDDYGLMAALRWHAESFSERTGLNVELQGEGPTTRLSQEVETVFFRIAQEAMTNVSKHANADRVDLMLEELDGLIRLTISDDGAGFDLHVSGTTERSGWGLVTMKERSQTLGGQFLIESEPGKGTRVIVEVKT